MTHPTKEKRDRTSDNSDRSRTMDYINASFVLLVGFALLLVRAVNDIDSSLLSLLASISAFTNIALGGWMFRDIRSKK